MTQEVKKFIEFNNQYIDRLKFIDDMINSGIIDYAKYLELINKELEKFTLNLKSLEG